MWGNTSRSSHIPRFGPATVGWHVFELLGWPFFLYYFFYSELRKYRRMIEPPPSARQIAVDVDRKLEEGQKVIASKWHLLLFLAIADIPHSWGAIPTHVPLTGAFHNSKFADIVQSLWVAKCSCCVLNFVLLFLSQNVRMLRAELHKLGESLQTAERACCHTTGAGKLRETLSTCDNILLKQVREGTCPNPSPRHVAAMDVSCVGDI